MPAYDRAIAGGADYLELDVQRTKDGVLVVVHDATLDRTARGSTADCTGRVAEKTIAQIESCDAGSWFNSAYPSLARAEFVGLRVPRLADLLARYGATMRLYIEPKDPESYPGIEADIVDELHLRGISAAGSDKPRVFVQSFSKSSLLRVRALDPTIPLRSGIRRDGSISDRRAAGRRALVRGCSSRSEAGRHSRRWSNPHTRAVFCSTPM